MLDVIRWLKKLRNAINQMSDLIYSHAGRHKPNGADPLFPADYDIYPTSSNTYDLGKEGYEWKSIHISDSISFLNDVEYLKKGIYAYKIKHNEGSHPTEVDDFVYRFLLKYLDNVETGTIIYNLSNSFNDDYYTAIYSTIIYVNNDGYYDFGLNSDDASALFIDGILASAWLNGHGVMSNWYKTSFNSVCSGTCDVDGDGNTEPCYRTTLHSNGIRLNKGWHSLVAILEEIGGSDQINVYIRPHQDEDPSKAQGTDNGWQLVGNDSVTSNYILDFRAIPISILLWMFPRQLWMNGIVINPERNSVSFYGDVNVKNNPLKINKGATSGDPFMYLVEGGTNRIQFVGEKDQNEPAGILISAGYGGRIGSLNSGAPLQLWANGEERVRLEADGSLRPTADNTQDIGNASYAWRRVFGYVHRLVPSSAPSSPLEGDVFFDSSLLKPRFYDGSSWRDLGWVNSVSASVSVANTETTLYDLTDVGAYSGWIELPQVDANWTIKMYVNGESTPWDQVSVSTTSSSSLNDRLVYINRVVVDGSVVTEVKITVVSDQSTSNTVNANLLLLR